MKLYLLTIAFILCSVYSHAQPIKVLVGGYDWAPYVIVQDNKYTGLTLDLIKQLNQSQDKFHFEFVLTSATRRFQDLADGRYQVIFFESKSWGWNPGSVESTKTFHSGSEVFITLRGKKKDQSYFDNLKGKLIKGITGYHYGFLGLSTAPKAAREYTLELTTTLDGNIQSVLNGRADLTIVPKEYLPIYFQTHPTVEDKLLVSKKLDQVYELGALLSPEKSPISADELYKYIEAVIKTDPLDKLVKSP